MNRNWWSKCHPDGEPATGQTVWGRAPRGDIRRLVGFSFA